MDRYLGTLNKTTATVRFISTLA